MPFPRRSKLKLSPETAPLPRQAPNLRAYEAYLKALDHWSRPTPESLALVKELLDTAVAFDPEFAPAHNSLGLYYTMLASIGIRPTREVIPLARAAVDEALRIEPSLPEAHALRGVWLTGYDDYDWHESERHWRVALAREPVASHVRLWYGNHYLAPIGRFEEALAAMATGVEADPLNLLYRHVLASGLRNAGRIEEAEDELRRILELDENFPLTVGLLGAVCAQQGRFRGSPRIERKGVWLDALVQSDRRTTRGASRPHRSREPRRDAARRAQTGHRMGSSGGDGRVSCDVRRIRSGGRMGRTSDWKPVSGTHPDPQTAHGAEP